MDYLFPMYKMEGWIPTFPQYCSIVLQVHILKTKEMIKQGCGFKGKQQHREQKDLEGCAQGPNMKCQQNLTLLAT